jgi:fatty-acyl-CoA synthase
MNMLLNAGPELKRSLDRHIAMMTAGAAPPAAVIEGMEGLRDPQKGRAAVASPD